MVPFLHSELLEDIDLDTFLKEDQATLRKRGWETVSRVVRELRDYLQRECGEGKRSPTTSSGMLCYRYMYTQFSFVLSNFFKN